MCRSRGLALATLCVISLSFGCVTTTPPHAEALRHNAICTQYMEQSLLDQAEPHCRLACEYSPQYPDCMVNLGLIEWRRGHTAEAKAWYIKALRTNNEQAQAYVDLGTIYQQEGEYGRARDVFRRALLVDPGYVAARYNLALVLLQLKHIDEAKRELNILIAVNPAFADPYYLLGRIAYDEGNRGEALIRVAQAVELAPARGDIQELFGDLLMDAGQFAQAQDAYRQCTDVDPDNAQCKQKLPLAVRYGKLAEIGLRDPGPAVATTPPSLLEAAQADAAKGLKDKAEAALLRCTRLDAGYAPCQFGLFQFYNQEGRIADAVIACRSFVKVATHAQFPHEIGTCENFLDGSGAGGPEAQR